MEPTEKPKPKYEPLTEDELRRVVAICGTDKMDSGTFYDLFFRMAGTYKTAEERRVYGE